MSSLPASLNENPQETQSPKEKSGLKLEWDTASYWDVETRTGMTITKCGRYRIDQVRSEFTSWRRGTVRYHLHTRLGVAPDMEGAQKLCEADCA